MKSLEEFDIKVILKELHKNYEFFYSEADLQFKLAWKIKEYLNNSNVEIILEYPNDDENKRSHTDIFLVEGEKFLPIELKYKTKAIKNIESLKYNGIEKSLINNLKNQGAKNNGCYGYVKDISRIEKLSDKDCQNFIKGYAIFITNDKSYIKEPRCSNGEKPEYINFSIHQGRELGKKLVPKKNGKFILENNTENIVGYSDKKRTVNIKNKYEPFKWRYYNDCLKDISSENEIEDDGNSTFYLLITEIK